MLAGILIFVGILWIGITIIALVQLGWIGSFAAVALIISIIFGIKKWGYVCANPKIITYLAIFLIVVGALMYLGQYFTGTTSYGTKYTECGLCEGDGIFNLKKCSLCGGKGGVYGNEKVYNSTTSNWLGVIIANAGVAMIISKLKFVDNIF